MQLDWNATTIDASWISGANTLSFCQRQVRYPLRLSKFSTFPLGMLTDADGSTSLTLGVSAAVCVNLKEVLAAKRVSGKFMSCRVPNSWIILILVGFELEKKSDGGRRRDHPATIGIAIRIWLIFPCHIWGATYITLYTGRMAP